MSASAPLPSPSRKTGREDAVWTSAISVGDVVRWVICHAAATSFIHMQTLDASHTVQSIRNVFRRSGAHADGFSMRGSSGAGRFSLTSTV